MFRFLASWARRYRIPAMFPVAHQRLLALKRAALGNQIRLTLLQRKREVARTTHARYGRPTCGPYGAPFWTQPQSFSSTLMAVRLAAGPARPLCPGSRLLHRLVGRVARFWGGRLHVRARAPPLAGYHALWAHVRQDQHQCFAALRRSPFGPCMSPLGRFSHVFARSFSTTNAFFTPSALPSALASAARAGPTRTLAAFGCNAEALRQASTGDHENVSRRDARTASVSKLGPRPRRRRVIRHQSRTGAVAPLKRLTGPAWAHDLHSLIAAARPSPAVSLLGGVEPVYVELELSVVSHRLSPLFSPADRPTADGEPATTDSPASVMAKLQDAQVLQQAHLRTVTRIVEQLTAAFPCQVDTHDSHVRVRLPLGLNRRQAEQALRNLGIDPQGDGLLLREVRLTPVPATPLPALSPMPQSPMVFPHLDLALSVYSSTESSSGSESWLDQTVPTLLMDQLATPPIRVGGGTVNDFLYQLDLLEADHYQFQARQPGTSRELVY
ncbi:hypothetical protein IWQ60_006745 [Tieghemiomyces parasiticus]|uniref:Uncharacterized protein n=1 Tax=Tieghemiomyces parasiticus TaxID=78921 RepID=A0A9W8A2D8_9FUNG|nr:hypothetical protein IWQ60_006745 [Tieghemiomyces parasiticus]